MVYITCSIFPEEGESVISAFCSQHSDAERRPSIVRWAHEATAVSQLLPTGPAGPVDPSDSSGPGGNRTATVEYAQKVAKWLGLSPKQASELVSSLAQVDNIVKFRPRSPEAASFAFNLANRLNSLTPQDIERMKKILDEGVRIYE